jgi:hypothetical protein
MYQWGASIWEIEWSKRAIPLENKPGARLEVIALAAE